MLLSSIHNTMRTQNKALRTSSPCLIEAETSGFRFTIIVLRLTASRISTCFWNQEEVSSLISGSLRSFDDYLIILHKFTLGKVGKIFTERRKLAADNTRREQENTDNDCVRRKSELKF